MTIKTEHAGAKNGGGHWGTRTEAKSLSKRARRGADKAEASDAHAQETYTEATPATAMGRRKNTKRWCGGKVGREHQPKCVCYHEVKRFGFIGRNEWKLLICSKCGKELDRWMPMNWTRVDGTPIGETRQPPEWAK